MLLPGDPGYNPGSNTGGGGGGGGGGGRETNGDGGDVTTGGTRQVNDNDLLGFAGLPPDLIAQLLGGRSRYPHTADGDNAYTQWAIALIRGSEWYRQTYPGIAEARALGFIGTDIGSEREYKQLYIQYNQYYQQYYGRNITWQEAFNLFSQGVQPTHLQQTFQGAAYVSANRTDIQYLSGAFSDQGRLSGDQLTALGNEQAGIDTPLGQLIQSRLALASARMQRIFQGTTATPSLSLGGGGLRADSLLTTNSPDVQS